MTESNLENKNIRKMNDDELILIVQNQYHRYRKGGFWKCENCNIKIKYSEKYKSVTKPVCSKCKSGINLFNSVSNKDFDSVEFEEIFRRYQSKIYTCCVKFRHIEDADDTYCDMLHRFFISVLTYDGRCKFVTYLWNNIRKRFEDFERSSSRICKNSSVQCQLCGRYVGAITRIHLMNNTIKPKAGFVGHKILHDKIIEGIGVEKFDELDNSFENRDAKEKWEGNRYSKKQNKIIKSMLVDMYRSMFPNYPLSMRHVSIYDVDPVNNIEYIHMIPDNCKKEIKRSGSYISKNGSHIPEDKLSSNDDVDFFLQDEIDLIEKDVSKEFSEKISDVLHKQYLRNGKRKNFIHTKDKFGLQKFLEDVLFYVTKGYSPKEINSITGYDEFEISFWLKKIKSSNEVKKVFNILVYN